MVPWLVGPALRVCRLEVGTELAESGLHVGRVCPGDGEEVQRVLVLRFPRVWSASGS